MFDRPDDDISTVGMLVGLIVYVAIALFAVMATLDVLKLVERFG